jgi:hypothetical protein
MAGFSVRSATLTVDGWNNSPPFSPWGMPLFFDFSNDIDASKGETVWCCAVGLGGFWCTYAAAADFGVFAVNLLPQMTQGMLVVGCNIVMNDFGSNNAQAVNPSQGWGAQIPVTAIAYIAPGSPPAASGATDIILGNQFAANGALPVVTIGSNPQTCAFLSGFVVEGPGQLQQLQCGLDVNIGGGTVNVGSSCNALPAAANGAVDFGLVSCAAQYGPNSSSTTANLLAIVPTTIDCPTGSSGVCSLSASIPVPTGMTLANVGLVLQSFNVTSDSAGTFCYLGVLPDIAVGTLANNAVPISGYYNLGIYDAGRNVLSNGGSITAMLLAQLAPASGGAS